MQVVSGELTSQLNRYLDYLARTKHSSANTLQAYRRDLEKFYGFADVRGVHSFARLTVEDVEEYKLYLVSAGLSASSVSRSLSALRGLFQYLIAAGLAENNPARCVHNDKAEKKELNILSSKEVECLLRQPDTTDIKGIRDKAMLELLYATGIRVSELIRLNVTDVNVALSFVRCGGEETERFIPLYPVAMQAIKNYLEHSRKLLAAGKADNALFLNVSGERMTRQGFWKILKAYVQAAGITKDITPYTLRHSFAAHLLENGADIHDIQEILGHRDPASTQRYAQYLKEKINTGYIKFHPRA